MKRRTLLTTVGVTLSPLSVGCLEDASSESQNEKSGPNGNDGDDNDIGSIDEFNRTVSIATVDEVPKEAPVEFELNLIKKEVNESGTAFLEITSRNTGDSTNIVVPYYKGRSADKGDPGILLYALTAPDSPSEDYTPECINDPKSTRGFDGFTEEGHAPELQPGETQTEEYIIVDDTSIEGCFPPGEYRFEREQIFETEEDEIKFIWGFSVEIREEHIEEM